MVMIDYSEIPDGSRDLIPEGEYTARITGIDDTMTDDLSITAPLRSKNGNLMWALTLEILSGQYTGRKIWDHFVFTKKALAHMKTCAKAVGIDTEAKRKHEATPTDFVGKTVVIDVHHDDWSGEKQAKVRFRGYSASLGSRPSGEPPSTSQVYGTAPNDCPF